ncbi:MAG: HslU--HslV peptidase proteolytic subunit, partial [Deltaproteobacteria bacterium]
EGIMAIGSGGPYALAAARALYRHTNMGAVQIAKEAMKIAAEICVYTNQQVVIETLPERSQEA